MVKWYLWIRMMKRDQALAFTILCLRLTVCYYTFKLLH